MAMECLYPLLSSLPTSQTSTSLSALPFFDVLHSHVLYCTRYHIISYNNPASSLLSTPEKRPHPQTGSSVFLLLIPNRSTNTPIYGPTTGKFLTNPAIVPKKSPSTTLSSLSPRSVRATPPFKMPVMFLNDSQKVGVAFCSGGLFFLLFGIFLFFDRALLAMGNILFLIGLTILIGPTKTILFFSRTQKIKGTAAFAIGIILILLRWPLVGFCIECYGIFVLFGDFLGTIAGFVRNLPVVGPYIGVLVDRLGISRRNTELPV